MIAFKLSLRNLIGAGLRTWLTVFVLSLSFVLIIWHRGLLDGWNNQMRHDTIAWEIGGGEYWHPTYDPYDPLLLPECHKAIPDVDGITPVLITQGSFYPGGRMQSVLLKGIDPHQSFLALPTSILDTAINEIPALIGMRLAASTGLTKGDVVTIRWRDQHGVFDATEARIVGIFSTTVQTIDRGQIWIPLSRLQAMMQTPGEATMLVARPSDVNPPSIAGWSFQSLPDLFKESDAMIQSKSISGGILYVLLLSLALLAIFDTQVLSIFRRQKEIGTYMALGMTRGQVISLFTIEGAMHGLLATFTAALYGIPFLTWQAKHGFEVPQGTEGFGITSVEKIFPVYSAGLVLLTIVLVLCAVTIVSYLPARKISTMKPTEAIRGKIQ